MGCGRELRYTENNHKKKTNKQTSKQTNKQKTGHAFLKKKEICCVLVMENSLSISKKNFNTIFGKLENNLSVNIAELSLPEILKVKTGKTLKR